MFAPDSRIDFMVLDFHSKQPIHVFKEISDGVFDSAFDTYDLKGGKGNWAHLITQSYDLLGFEAMLPYMSKSILDKLLPLERIYDTKLPDFKIIKPINGEVDVSGLFDLVSVSYLDRQGENVVFEDYVYNEVDKIITVDPTFAEPLIIYGLWLDNAIVFQYSETVRPKFVSLIVKQRLKFQTGETAELSVFVPKAVVENGLEFLLGNMNKNLKKTPMSFVFLKDCSEKITVSIKE